jgi:hypothetical protein
MQVNSSLTADRASVVYRASHNIGVAIDTPAGLVCIIYYIFYYFVYVIYCIIQYATWGVGVDTPAGLVSTITSYLQSYPILSYAMFSDMLHEVS